MKENFDYLTNVLGVKWVGVRDSKRAQEKTLVISVPKIEIPPPVIEAPRLQELPNLAQLENSLSGCTKCKLHSGRKSIVFGAGAPNADLMFVGEGPGEQEDLQGLPFVGAAGQLLTKMIVAMGLSRDEVYIANVVKCRPPMNRNPEPDEIAECSPFLKTQIQLVNPKIVVALGAFSAQTLLVTEEKISHLRGRVIDFQGRKLIATYHPAFLLRNPGQKKAVWDDLKIAMKELGLPLGKA